MSRRVLNFTWELILTSKYQFHCIYTSSFGYEFSLLDYCKVISPNHSSNIFLPCRAATWFSEEYLQEYLRRAMTQDETFWWTKIYAQLYETWMFHFYNQEKKIAFTLDNATHNSLTSWLKIPQKCTAYIKCSTLIGDKKMEGVEIKSKTMPWVTSIQ